MPVPLRWAAALAVAWAFGLAPAASAAPSDVAVGAVRAPLQRAGAPLRGEPLMGAKVLGNVPHGTRLTVEKVQDGWLRVTTKVADGTTVTGWVRAGETVEPYALTGSGRTAGAAGVRSQGEQSAAGRGFTEQIEQQYAVSQAALRAAYQLLDTRVEPVKPSPSEVREWSEQGRLGFPGRTR